MIRSPPFALAIALLASACMVGPDFERPQTSANAGYSAAGDAPLPADQHLAVGKATESNWTAFRSPELDRVVELALSDNQNVAAAKARLAEAQIGQSRSRGQRLFDTSQLFVALGGGPLRAQ